MDVFPTRIISSPIPDICLKSACVLGIDEAGRGPFLGPMTYACAFWPSDDDARISKLGFDDSKALTDAKRRALFKALQAHKEIGYVVLSISAEAISEKMLRRTPVSLNAISHDAAEQLVRIVLDAGITLAHVYVDTVGDSGYYQTRLTRQFNNRVPFTVCPKADSLYKVVSAASICAKVIRDNSLSVDFAFREPFFAATCLNVSGSIGTDAVGAHAEETTGLRELEDDALESKEGSETFEDDDEISAPSAAGTHVTHPCTAGSGYPGDPLTKRWIADNLDPLFGWPSVARFSWSTARVALKGPSAVRVTWEMDDESTESGAAPIDAKQQHLQAFFSASSATRPAAGRFFAKRGIEQVTGHGSCL